MVGAPMSEPPLSSPSQTRVFRHEPVAESQLSIVPAFPSSQLTGAPEHVPVFPHMSPVVQTLPSLQSRGIGM